MTEEILKLLEKRVIEDLTNNTNIFDKEEQLTLIREAIELQNENYKLEKEIEELKIKNMNLQSENVRIMHFSYDPLISIPKSKIEDKIKNLEAVINEFYNSGGNLTISDEFQYKIDVLQELLEREERI